MSTERNEPRRFCLITRAPCAAVRQLSRRLARVSTSTIRASMPSSNLHTCSILLDKLSCSGVNGVAKSLLQSYLSHRHQVVDFRGSTSDTLEIKTRVPQGSVLRPFLFLVYINDLPSCTELRNRTQNSEIYST